jgi:hypothetical protein
MGHTVILVFDKFPRPISRRPDRGFAFAPADDFDAVMIDCDSLISFVVIYLD